MEWKEDKEDGGVFGRRARERVAVFVKRRKSKCIFTSSKFFCVFVILIRSIFYVRLDALSFSMLLIAWRVSGCI